MERTILDDTAICLHKCCCKKFFAGKQGENVILLFYSGTAGLYSVEITFQCLADACYEPYEFAAVCLADGQSS